MRLAWLAVPCLVLACSDGGTEDSGTQPTVTTAGADTAADTAADDDSDNGDDMTTTGSGTFGSQGDSTTSGTTTAPATTSSDSSSESIGGLDCTAPMDCATCFDCAVTQGPCMAGYDACVLETFCVPSLVCVQNMCAEDGLMQSCVDTCCMSCVDLGTCGQVDPVVQCAQAECAEFCGPVSCP